jgi:hypothetical protein
MSRWNSEDTWATVLALATFAAIVILCGRLG